MTDREKLIEILRYGMDKYFLLKFEAEIFADLLISNGVTFATDTNVGSKWIPVTERLPEEHDSIFAKLFGTEHWSPTMFRTVSDEVLVCVECEDDTKRVRAMRTKDGDWRTSSVWQEKVTHWMPLPEAPKEEERKRKNAED